MRYFAEIAYHGAAFHGWQVQPDAETVQGQINYVFSKLLREDIEVVGSGRTDAGVHCYQQYAHFDCQEIPSIKDFLHRANSFLSKDILIRDVKKVKEDAHARFDAQKRTYRYFIDLMKNPFADGLAHHLLWRPDMDLLQEASTALLQFEDFEAFSKVHSDVHTHNCTIYDAHWEVLDEQKIMFEVTANRFLRGMVRIMVGNLLHVGLGKMSIETMKEILNQKDRKKAARHLVPGHGLYLYKVSYPTDIFLEK